MNEPTRALALACMTLLLAACGGGESADSTRSAPAYSLGGTVSGLDEGYLDIRNGLDVRRVTASSDGRGLDQAFSFDTPLPAGVGYDVQIVSDPQAQFGLQCELSAAQGSMPARAVSSVVIRCARVRSLRLLAGAPTPVLGRDGLASQVALDVPMWVTLDAGGNLYLSEQGAIRRVTPTGVVSTVGRVPIDPRGIAVDGAGNVYTIARWAVFKTTPQGSTNLFAGEVNEGGWIDGVGTVARFLSPMHMTTDSSGNLLVLDSIGSSALVRRVSLAGVVQTISPELTGGNIIGIARDANDNVFVCQREVATSVVTVLRVTPTTVASVVTFNNTSGGPCAGMVIDATRRIHVTDGDVIRSISPTGQVSTTAGFDGANGLAADAAGNLYVANVRTSTILRVTPAGAISTYVGVPHSPASSTGEAGSTDGEGPSARFSAPRSVAVDSHGNVFVADAANHVVRRITPQGVVSTLAGAARQPGHVDATGSAARFNGLTSIAVDSQDNVYVVELINRTLRRITPAGVVSTVAGHPNNAAGQADGIGTAARLGAPYGLTILPNGNAYIADSGNGLALRHVALSNAAVTTVAGVSLGGPGMAADRDGNLFVHALGGIARLTPGGSLEQQFTDRHTISTADAISVGPDNELYVVDATRNVVFLLTPNLFQGLNFDYYSSVVAGAIGSLDMELGPLPASLGRPAGVAATARRVYVTADNAVLFFDR